MNVVIFSLIFANHWSILSNRYINTPIKHFSFRHLLYLCWRFTDANRNGNNIYNGWHSSGLYRIVSVVEGPQADFRILLPHRNVLQISTFFFANFILIWGFSFIKIDDDKIRLVLNRCRHVFIIRMLPYQPSIQKYPTNRVKLKKRLFVMRMNNRNFIWHRICE